MQPREFLLRLSVCRGLGLVSKYKVWQEAASLYQFNDIKAVLKRTDIGKYYQNNFLQNWYSTATDQQVQINAQIPFITIVDHCYPIHLRNIHCPPLVLYYAGNINLLSQSGLAVVGARKMSSYARSSLQTLLPKVIHRRHVIISGLAAGVDGLSHEITLQEKGKTIGIIGSGIDRVYPKSHFDLQRQVSDHGLLLSEYPLGSAPLRHHFVERNRLIAGLCQACLIVEARNKSGSLITASIALQENRNVLAIPGPINQPLSQGCNELIAAGAKLVMCADDILEELSNRFYRR